MSSSDDDDEDFVPEEEVDDDEQLVMDEEDDTSKQAYSVATDSSITDKWKDLNESTNVSQASQDKSAKLLRRLTSGKPMKRKKRKVREFEFPVLSVDPKRHRQDLASKATDEISQTVQYAGQTYQVRGSSGAEAAKIPSTKSSGVDQVLASMQEPRKVSTMEKSSIDWDTFKTDEGIEDELKQATKDGYVEKQEFLHRLDQKQFELEKAERDKQRRLREQK